MHTAETMRHWMHLLHDESAKAVHFTGHLLHEKSFWGIVAILAVLVALFTMLVFFGNKMPIEEYNIPMRYGPYY